MQKDESSLRRSVRKRKLTGPIRTATEFTMPVEPNNREEVEIPQILDPPTVLPIDKFNKQSEKEKMGTVYSVLSEMCEKMSEIHVALYDDVAELGARLTTCQTQADNNTTSLYAQSTQLEKKATKDSVTKLDEEIGVLKRENNILKGLVQKQHVQIRSLNDKVMYLTKKSMENNLVISGLEGDIGKKENCVNNVIEFLTNKVKIQVEEHEIFVAHRSQGTVKNYRNMIVRCTIPLKERILKNAKNLKDKKNDKGEYYMINKQIPEQMIEKNRQIRDTIKKQKDKESHLPNNQKSKIEVIKGEVPVNDEVVKTNHLLPVQPLDLFPNPQEKGKWNNLKMVMSDVHSEDGSDFIAMAVKVQQFADVKCAYKKAKALYPAANHVVAAYKLRSGYEGFQDDYEHGAGHKLLKALEESKHIPPQGVVVFVARTYDGTHIGPKWHTIAESVMHQAITRLE